LYCVIDKEKKDVAGEAQSPLFRVCLSKNSGINFGFRVRNFITLLMHILG